jgi:hypothetical protein
MHNSFASHDLVLHQVWGGPEMPPAYVVPAGTKMMTIYSPLLKQWVASITTLDYRYDAIVTTHDFVLDASLLPVEGDANGPSYYLNRMRAHESA